MSNRQKKKETIYAVPNPMWLSDTFVFRKHEDEEIGTVWVAVGSTETAPLFRTLMLSGRPCKSWFMTPEDAAALEAMPFPLTVWRAYDEYQERSKTSGDRAEQLAWAMIVLLAGQLIGGSKYAEFYMLGGAALLYLLLSTVQSVWQSVTIWLVKCRIKRTGITLSDYPDWVGFGAWVFYWLKMIIIAIGAIYGASRFISFAM